jgi:hypothetical protein
MGAPMSTRDMGRTADRLASGFYGVVAVASLAGATQAATTWLGWGTIPAAAAVGAVELGGVALSAIADQRRRLGETALGARVLSAATAGGAVAFQLAGHHGLSRWFFGGLSALGYGVWLIHSGNRRRDALRAAGKAADTAPAYGLVRWLRRPWLTRRARALALADPTLGLHGSITAAAEQVRAERRRAAIATALRRKLTAGRDRVSATIAVNTYDLDRVAQAIANTADYDGLAALLAADLTPTALTTTPTTPAPTLPARSAQTAPVVDSTPAVVSPASAAAKPARRTPARTSAKPSSAERVAKAVAKTPGASPAQIAAKLGLSERTVQRHMPPRVDTVTTPDPAMASAA